MNSDLLEWLTSNYGREQYKPGLSRVTQALTPLSSALQNIRKVTIAGTNGKGETTLRLGQLLDKRKFCAWTSPHVLRLTERFRSEEGEISEQELRFLIEHCHREVSERNLSLSFYEFLFFVFCTWASRRSPEYLLLEVGLGGKLDAVNALDAELVLLPSISRDHQEFLGHRYDQILAEKLGVLRPGACLISYLDLHYLRERARKQCETVGAKFYDLNDSACIPTFAFSRRNHFLAHAAFNFLEKRSQKMNSSEKLTSLEHRGEVLVQGSEWHLFGSHNVDGMRKLIQFLKAETYNLKRPPFDAIVVAFSQRSTKDLRVMLKMLKESGPGPVSVVLFNHPKAASKELMETLTRQEGLELVEDLDAIFQQLQKRKVLVTGSYYFIGHFKSRLLDGYSAI